MKRTLYAAWAVSMALMLSACAQLGLATPETFNQKVAVAYGTVTQVRETATLLLAQKKITAPDAQQVQVTADTARQGIETARILHAQNATEAEQKLTAVRAVLNALAAYLATKQP